MVTIADGERLPVRVELADVEGLEAAVSAFRSLDYRLGGESCRRALRAIGSWTLMLRNGTVPARLVRRLSRDLGDLYNLLAWTEFDTGRVAQARRHFAVADELAVAADDGDLVANICYRTGRLNLHHLDTAGAFAEFGRGQAVARRAGSRHAQAILHANQAWAHALRGQAAPALTELGRAEDDFAAVSGPSPPWAAFFDANDLAAMCGTVHVELARSVDASHARAAISFLAGAVAGYGPEMARSRALTQILLALGHAMENDLDEADRVVAEAIRTARSLRSARPKDRLASLETVVRDRLPEPDARQLLERVRSFRREPGPP
ncbi:hypothetical protein AB0J40_08070 [Amycolatopsis sp. NPDC049691]|uniref:hypothetical protein n=1 Tax=Amycolatopsis sp. NPDC049691 TaxID=3155155 RepID=UPI00341E7BA8